MTNTANVYAEHLEHPDELLLDRRPLTFFILGGLDINLLLPNNRACTHSCGSVSVPERNSILPTLLTVAMPSSPGVRQLSVGDVSVSVRGDRGVLGVRGDGRVSHAL